MLKQQDNSFQSVVGWHALLVPLCTVLAVASTTSSQDVTYSLAVTLKTALYNESTQCLTQSHYVL